MRYVLEQGTLSPLHPLDPGVRGTGVITYRVLMISVLEQSTSIIMLTNY